MAAHHAENETHKPKTGADKFATTGKSSPDKRVYRDLTMILVKNIGSMEKVNFSKRASRPQKLAKCISWLQNAMDVQVVLPEPPLLWWFEASEVLCRAANDAHDILDGILVEATTWRVRA